MDGYCIVCIKSKDGMSYFWSLGVVGSLKYLISLIDTQSNVMSRHFKGEAVSEL
jgi:hypothetical protein